MKKSLELKLEQLLERFEEIGHLISEQEVIADTERFTALSKEYAQLEPVANDFDKLKKAERELAALQDILSSDDSELILMAKEEQPEIQSSIETLQQALQFHLIPKDPLDEGNVYLEIRAGTGGDGR